MSRVLIRRQAEEDLLEIWLGIAVDSMDHADAMLDRIGEQLKKAAEHPGMGRERPELLAGLRSFVVYPYVVFYLPLGDGVDVVRVLHGSRDIDGLFGAAEGLG